MIYDLVMSRRKVADSVRGHARQMRREPTPPERRLWQALRGRRFAGNKFRRQQPIGNYILDFFCPDSKLSIELDGSTHAGEESGIYDAERTEFLRSAGIREIRFWNGDVDRDLDGVLGKIAEALRMSNPSPLVGEGKRKRG